METGVRFGSRARAEFESEDNAKDNSILGDSVFGDWLTFCNQVLRTGRITLP